MTVFVHNIVGICGGCSMSLYDGVCTVSLYDGRFICVVIGGVSLLSGVFMRGVVIITGGSNSILLSL